MTQSLPLQRVPLSTRFFWGCGGLTSFFIMQALFALATNIYQIKLQVNPVYFGMALAIPRFLDGFIDPVIGNMSDNARTRWGRRKPFILVGATLCALMLPFLWTPPAVGEYGILAYFILMSCIYTAGYAIFEVPYTAMGFEMTQDHDERTRVIQWRFYMGLLGMLVMPWAYSLCFYFGKDELQGAPRLSILMSLVILGGALITIWKTPEKIVARPASEHSQPLLKSLKETLRCRPFLMLMSVNLIVRIGIASIGAMSTYINIYWLFHMAELAENKKMAGVITGWVGTLTAIASYVAIPVIIWFSARSSKKNTMIISLAIALVSSFATWFAMDPRWPYLQILPSTLASAGMVGCWVMMNSMVADVCDENELQTGVRREGLFGASMSMTEKLSIAISSTLGGVLLKLAGFNEKTADTAGVAVEVIKNLRLLLVGFQCAALLLAIGIVIFYPLSRKKCEEIRRTLDQRKAEKSDDMAVAPR